MGFNFLYDDSTNTPFRFKAEEQADKSRYEVQELYSNVIFDLFPNLTPESFQQAGLTGPNAPVDFTIDNFDAYEDRFKPEDEGQEGQDLVVSSLDPARVLTWSKQWFQTLSSANQEEREEKLPFQHTHIQRILEDLSYLIRQAECAMNHGVLLRLHHKW